MSEIFTMMYTTTLQNELYGLAVGTDHKWYKTKVIKRYKRNPKVNSVTLNKYSDKFELLSKEDLKELDG